MTEVKVRIQDRHQPNINWKLLTECQTTKHFHRKSKINLPKDAEDEIK